MKGKINKREKAISFIAPTIVLFIVMYSSKLFSGNNLDRLINFIIFLIYSSLFLLKREWWNFKKLMLSTVVITIFVLLSVVYFNSLINICIIFILIPTLGKTLKHPDYLVYSAIVYLEPTIMFLVFIKLEHLEFLALTLIYVVAVLLIRDRKLAVKNSDMMEKYLKQLEVAHRGLQESAIVSMNNAVLSERTRIARDIHDAVGHSLTSIIVQLQAVKYMIKDNPKESEDTIEEMMKVAENNYVLTIAYNGRFQGNNISEGFGLSVIRERILELGGKASFEPNSPTGFKIKVEIPN